jgi:hypothetical protein
MKYTYPSGRQSGIYPYRTGHTHTHRETHKQTRDTNHGNTPFFILCVCLDGQLTGPVHSCELSSRPS